LLIALAIPNRSPRPGLWLPQFGNEDVGGLDVTMNNSFLVRMLDGAANLDEQAERSSVLSDFWSQ